MSIGPNAAVDRLWPRQTLSVVPPQTLSEAGVSEREAEVLGLLADRATNAEIAARPFVSVRTVESHVSSLLRKLGAADRRQLARLALALGADAGHGLPTPAPPATAAVATPPAPLAVPVSLTSFVGRATEVAELTAALNEHRLVTATGPGGVGRGSPPPPPPSCGNRGPMASGSSTWCR